MESLEGRRSLCFETTGRPGSRIRVEGPDLRGSICPDPAGGSQTGAGSFAVSLPTGWDPLAAEA